ncbi:MAG TPA: penicillin-binding protein 2, partial [Bacteroidota bacterium]|nr:penicillin-binding protein 2 [Bacteroidota bacterium]
MPALPHRDIPPEDPGEGRRWRRRLRLLRVGLLIFFGFVCLRLVQIQIVESERFAQAADRQYKKTLVLPALRGSLLDRNGSPIATSTMYVSVTADPKNVDSHAAALAKSLSKITGKKPGYYLGLLKKGKKGRYAMLERSLEQRPVYAYKLDTLNGVTIREKSTRVYHTGIVAGQLLGMTNDGDSGIAGIELGFDKPLTGIDGYVVYQRVSRMKDVPSVDYPRVEPVPGRTVMLTIDMLLQQIAESELERGVKENDAEGGIVVMIRPETGEVLALAQYPRVNPAQFGKASKENQKLRAVTDMVEPGSVFKLVTAAAALEHGLISSERKFDAENGVYKVYRKGRKTPRVIKDVHKYPTLTFRESIEHSSNIVMAKASDLIGNELLYTTARDFGFGTKTGIDVPAEIGGRLKKPVEWSSLTRHSMSYGYEVGVTPIQIAAAYAAIANGGVLMRPYILGKVLGPDGSVLAETEPAPVREVVSGETAAMLTSFLEGVVERGTATSAKIPGIRIAGKTGTSKRLVKGKYEGSEYTASFVGFFPAEDPKLVCLVMLDKPRGINYYGGTTSAPIFREIVKRIVASSDGYAIPIAEELPGDAVRRDALPSRERARQKTASAAAQKRSTAVIARQIVPDVRGMS